MAIKSYFNVMEITDAYLLNSFNGYVHWFKNIRFNKRGSVIDAVGEDIKGRKVHIELKNRQGRYKDFTDFCKHNDTIFIECGKLSAFSRIMQSGFSLNEQELIINLFDDGKTVVIHDINKPQPLKWLPNRAIKNPGTGEQEFEHRIGLLISEADIYRYDEEEDTFKKVELPF